MPIYEYGINKYKPGYTPKYLCWFHPKKHFIEKKQWAKQMVNILRFASTEKNGEFRIISIKKNNCRVIWFSVFSYAQLGERFNIDILKYQK